MSWGWWRGLQKAHKQTCVYLSVRVLVVLVVAGVVILLDEAKVLLPLPLQDALSPLSVSWEIALWGGGGGEEEGGHLMLFETHKTVELRLIMEVDLDSSVRFSGRFCLMRQRVLGNSDLHEFPGRVSTRGKLHPLGNTPH